MHGARGRERKKVGRNSERGATFESSPNRLNCRGKTWQSWRCLPDRALSLRGTVKHSSTTKGTKVHQGEATAQGSTGSPSSRDRVEGKLNRLPEQRAPEVGIVVQ